MQTTWKFTKIAALVYACLGALHLTFAAIVRFGECSELIFGWGVTPIRCEHIPDAIGSSIRTAQLFWWPGVWIVSLILGIFVIVAVLNDLQHPKRKGGR